MAAKKEIISTPIKIIGWFGIALACTFLITGVVSGVLSILDRTFMEMNQNIIFVLYGTMIIVASVGFRNLQKWGYYALWTVLIIFIAFAIFKHTDLFGIILGILFVIILTWMSLPPVRKHYFKS
ncbi:MAG: hypothetical protein CVT49_06415 [candidate division Zixibacteria bacterium HGW-Zixibacteria-1]|nr:MAG: hypothetical protein CVT49_06415 [candidate division Zixibacteria bacterium HGW-Zixibacteria-1]